MGKNRNRRHALGVLFLFMLLLIPLQTGAESSPLSVWNGRPFVVPESSPESYSFLVVGHAYGAPSNVPGFPAATLLGNIASINNEGAAFLVLLGDSIERLNPTTIGRFEDAFLDRVEMPVFGVIGNHEAALPGLYREKFGQSFFQFQYGNDLFVFLDSEKDNGRLVGPQFDFLKREIEKLYDRNGPKRLFLFSHRLLWAVHNPALREIIPHVNGPIFHLPEMSNVEQDILPLLLKAEPEKEIVWISGDVGLPYSFPLFYHQWKDRNIYFLATGLGNIPRDAMLKITVPAQGAITFTPRSLTGQELGPIERYGIDFWKSYFRKDRHYLRQLLMLSRDLHFRLGAVISAAIVGALFFTAWGAIWLWRKRTTK